MVRCEMGSRIWANVRPRVHRKSLQMTPTSLAVLVRFGTPGLHYLINEGP